MIKLKIVADSSSDVLSWPKNAEYAYAPLKVITDEREFEDIPAMAKHAEKEANPLYPVPRLMTRDELEAFYYEIGEFV